MNETIHQFQNYLREHGRSERTIQAYGFDVERYMRWCESGYGQAFTASMLNRSDLHDYQVHCRKLERAKAATWNRYLASLTIFAVWLGVDVSEAMTRAESQKLAPKSLAQSDYRRFRLAARESIRTAATDAARNLALRNAAIITLLADGGLREGEIVHLRVEDVLLGERKGRVIICDAKGNKDRTVPLDKDSVDTLKAWLAVRPAAHTGAEMFVGKRGDALQERGIQKLVAGLAADAQIGHVTPHQLRHTAAYRLIQAGASLTEVAELLGHANLDVTKRYTLPHYEDLENLVEVM
jgi:site-specific recombinase XerD